MNKWLITCFQSVGFGVAFIGSALMFSSFKGINFFPLFERASEFGLIAFLFGFALIWAGYEIFNVPTNINGDLD